MKITAKLQKNSSTAYMYLINILQISYGRKI